MSFIYDYSQLTHTKYSTISREMDNYHENESSSSSSNQRQPKTGFVEHSNANNAAEFNASNNQFDCLINDVDSVHADTISNGVKTTSTEDDIISMASRYESFLTNDPITRNHNIPTENTMQLNYTNNHSNYNNYMVEKSIKLSNEFLTTLNKFQYVLMAPTSPAVKSNEETLTYLNQGQNYELKLNRFNNNTLNNTSYSHTDSTHSSFNYQNDSRHVVEDVKPLLVNGKISRNETNTTNSTTNSDKMRTFNINNQNENPIVYLSIVRLCFWDRKLQEVELEEIREWEKEYNNLRMLEIDSNSSFGIIEVRLSEVYTNAAEVIWNGKTGASIFFRCNCTSTAFAPHKHGGEKGIHMRLQIDTYDLSNSNNNLNNFYQNGTTNLTINTTASNDYHSSSILSPPNSSSSPVSNKFVKDDLEFNSSSSEYNQQKLFQHSININNWRHVCSSYCRIQLFRLKGAQRKLKTDRSKIERLNPPDLRKRYQPSNKITMLYNCPYDQLFSLLPFNHNHIQNNHNEPTGSSSETHQCDFNTLYMNPINNNLSQINSNSRVTYPNYGVMVSSQYATNPNEYLSYNNEPLANTASGSDERHHFYYDQNLVSLNPYNSNQTLINKSIKENSLHEMVSTSSIQPSYHDLGVTTPTTPSYQNDDHFRYKRKSSLNNNTNIYPTNNNGGSKYKMAKLNETAAINYASSSSNNKTPPPSNVSSSPSSPPLSPSNQVNFSNQYQNQYSANVSPTTTIMTNITPLNGSSSLNYPLSHDCTNKYVQEWLINNRFCHLMHLFTNYTSNDFLRLSKEDMINLCGAPDGIRCYNMAHNIQIRPKLTIFITFQSQTYFSAVFLADWKNKFLINKIFNHYYQFLISLPNNDNKNLKQLTLQKDEEKVIDENTNNNNKCEKINSQKESEQIESSKLEGNNSNNNSKTTETSNEQDNFKNCENYIIDESHYKFYELIKNSSFDYELFLKVKDILVKANDEVLNNFQDQSRFMIEFELPTTNTLKHSSSSQSISNISIINKASSKSDSNLSNQNISSKTKMNNTVKIIMIPLD